MDPPKTLKIKPFINKYNWEGITFHQKKMIGKDLRKIICTILMSKETYHPCVSKHNPYCEKKYYSKWFQREKNSIIWHWRLITVMNPNSPNAYKLIYQKNMKFEQYIMSIYNNVRYSILDGVKAILSV